MKKSVLLLFAAFATLVASAHDFYKNGIYYNITSDADKTAEVTYKGYDSWDYNEYSGSITITIPATVTHNGTQYSVTSIGEEAFCFSTSLESITIPEGVTSIGDYAFESCSSLTSITIPESVTSIGSSAFRDCRRLTSITIPEGVTSIGDLVFSGCSNLTDINIPEGVTSIGDYAFYYCSSLTAITIPEGVTSIGNYAFSGCSSLTDIVVAEGNQTYDSRGGCNAIIETNSNTLIQGCSATIIPESVTSIGDEAFRECYNLTAITLPEGVTSIGDYAFSGCSSLTAINIPEGVTNIGKRAFYGCMFAFEEFINKSVCTDDNNWGANLYDKEYDGALVKDNVVVDCRPNATVVTLPEGVTSIGNNAFNNCSSLTDINIPESVTSIGNYAFENCSSLTAITIPEGVTSIGDRTFSGCDSLESLHIAPNVDCYGDKVFEGCTTIKELTVMGNVMPEIPSENLTSITLYSPIPLETTEFASKVYRNTMLNIPKGSLTRYENADVWKNFWYVNEFDPKEGKDIFLTINQADNGYVKQHLTEGTVCTFTIVAAEGWTIHSVTFNGEEVTDQLTEEGIYTTPALSDDAVLNIAYEKTDNNTMVANTTARTIKVQGHRGTLRITGTTQGEAISVYTTGGTLVTQESAEDSDTEITLPTNQVYLVKVADTVVKIGM